MAALAVPSLVTQATPFAERLLVSSRLGTRLLSMNNIFSPTPYRPNYTYRCMYLQFYIPQREQYYTVIADKTGNHIFPACMEIYMHDQAETYAGAYSCIARFLPERLCKTIAGLKVLASNVIIITSSRRHLPISFPDFILHAAVEIFFLLSTCCILCCILCRLCLQSKQ